VADIPTLADYLASLRKRRWQPGILDCGVFMADWAILRCGRDPIADVRGTYSTEEQFQIILGREGGFLNSCRKRMNAIGMRRTRNPAEGDLMAVMAPYALLGGEIQSRPTGAICVNQAMRAVVTSDLGIVIADSSRLPMVRAWSIANA
jgi:hypothetical protein